MYRLSIGGAKLLLDSEIRSLIGDLEYARLVLGSGVFPRLCSIGEGISDSLRRGTCDAGIDRLGYSGT